MMNMTTEIAPDMPRFLVFRYPFRYITSVLVVPLGTPSPLLKT